MKEEKLLEFLCLCVLPSGVSGEKREGVVGGERGRGVVENCL